MPTIVRFHETGEADVLRLEELPDSPPGKGEVRLKVAAIWMQYMTAYGALIEYGKLKKEASVLITAGSSSVGLAAIQIAKSVGALALATTRGADKKQFLLDAGADHVIVTDEADLAAQVMAITEGRGADIIFDPVAGPFLEKLAQAAALGYDIRIRGPAHGRDTVSPVRCPRQRPDHPRIYPVRDCQAARVHGPRQAVYL